MAGPDRVDGALDRALLRLLHGAREPALLPAIDWGLALPLLDALGVAPLLAFRLRAAGLAACLPTAVWDALWQRYLGTAAQNTRRLAELGRVATALERARVPALAYKGAVLTTTVYPSVGCRPMGDVDLLIRPEHQRAALAALRALGYRLAPGAQPDAFVLRYGSQALLVGPDGLHIDLHWQLFGEPWLAVAFPVDLEGLWARAVPYALDGGTLLRPAPADELLLLCLHLALHHSYAGLLPYVDLDLVARGELPWPTFVALATAAGARSVCAEALGRTAVWLGAPVPAWVLGMLAPGLLRRCTLRAVLGVPALYSAVADLAAGPRERLVHLALLERPAALPALARRVIWPGLDYLAARYGGRRTALLWAALWPGRALWIAIRAVLATARRTASSGAPHDNGAAGHGA